MTEKEHIVYIYVFDSEDGRKAEERLKEAVLHYLKECGTSLLEISMHQTDEKYCKTAGQEKTLTQHRQTKQTVQETTLTQLLQVQRTEKGKPYFPNCPEIQFSISHSGACWVCAVSDTQIGVDIQEHSRQKDETIEEASARFRKMAHRFFRPVEAQFVELDSYNNFFTAWTAREAYVKYTGQGIDKYFSEHCVVPEQQELWFPLSGQAENISWQALGKRFWKTQYPENHTLCVCTKEQKECFIVDCRKNRE